MEEKLVVGTYAPKPIHLAQKVRSRAHFLQYALPFLLTHILY